MNERQAADAKTLHPLLDKLIAGCLTEAEFAELQNRLRNNPYEQQAYFDYLDLDTDLREMTQGSVIPSVDRNDEAVFWSPKLLLAVLAASLLLVVSALAWISKNHGTKNRIAQDSLASDSVEIAAAGDALLVQSAGARFFRDVVPSVGQSLKSNHPYALTAGMIELKFANGAEVILEAPTAIEIVNSQRMIVKQGSCSVHAPPGAEGFEVLTPEAEVTDLGTRFAVSVTENGETEVQVVEGAAEVRHRNQQVAEKVLLKEHQASRLDGGHLSSIDFAPDQYRKRLPDRLMGFQVGNSNGKTNGLLQQVSVQRSGKTYDYGIGQLIGMEVIHFRGGSNTHCLSTAVSNLEASEADRRSVLESDSLLHTGMLNLGGSKEPLIQDPILKTDDPTQTTPGMAIRFREPVVNGPGPDVVFFELQCAMNPLEGDAFHVSPLRWNTGFRSLTVTQYDITLDSPEAQLVPDFSLLQFRSQVDSLDKLLHGKFEPRTQTMPFYAIGVGIDLSDLGYAADAKVEELFFQDASDVIGDADDIVDPVFIGGLPPIKEETK
jgi:FecR protein